LGSAPYPAGELTAGAYSAPPDPLAGFLGPTSKGGKGGRGREERRGEVRKMEGEEWEGRRERSPCSDFTI